MNIHLPCTIGWFGCDLLYTTSLVLVYSCGQVFNIGLRVNVATCTHVTHLSTPLICAVISVSISMIAYECLLYSCLTQWAHIAKHVMPSMEYTLKSLHIGVWSVHTYLRLRHISSVDILHHRSQPTIRLIKRSSGHITILIHRWRCPMWMGIMQRMCGSYWERGMMLYGAVTPW